MTSLFDQYGNLDIDDLIVEQPSFQKIMEDGVVTQDEISEQSERVFNLIHDFEKSANPAQIEQMREILAELSVLVAISDIR